MIDSLKRYHELVFRVLYLIHLFVSYNTYINIGKIPVFTMVALMGASVVCGLCQIGVLWENLKKKNIFLIVSSLFIVSYVISSISTMRYGIGGNIKCIIWLVLQMLFLYIYFPRNKKDAFVTLKWLGILTVIYLAFISTVSLDMLVKKTWRFRQGAEGVVQFYGFWYGRLYGLFNDANHGGVINVIGVMIAFALALKTKKILSKVFYAYAILVMTLYIYFTDSRTALVSMIVGIATFIIVYYISTIKSVKDVIKPILLIVVMSVAILTSQKMTQKVYPQVHSVINNWIYNMNNQTESNNQNTNNNTQTNENNFETEINVGRGEEVLSKDISNRRFEIWGSGIEIFKTSPVVGISYKNVVPYAKEVLPQTYLINNDYKVFDSFHNTFVDVMVAQGVIGTALFLILMLVNVIYVFKNIIFMTTDRVVLGTLLGIVAIVLVSSMFISNVLYVNSVESYYFWGALGFLNYFISSDKVKA